MPRRVAALALLALALSVLGLSPAAPAQTRATIPLSPCKPGKPLLCGTVTVPLDYSGKTPGTLDLAVAELPATGTPRGTFFMIAGGPGQGSLEAYQLSDAGSAAFFQKAFPGYNLVTFDDRGTGQSAPLSCPEPAAKLSAADIVDTPVVVAQCAEEIGPTRVFFGTRDHADDVEQVRRALGLGKIGVYGVSYGTKESMAYALGYPQNVERILLDSVVVPEVTDLFALNTLKQVPISFARMCANNPCAGLGTRTGEIVAALANKLQAHPIVARVEDPTKPGRLSTITIDGYRLMNLIVDADLLQPVAASLPAAVQAAQRGWNAPLVRLFQLDAGSNAVGQFNVGLFVTTVCDDGFFPWTPTSPIAGRQALYDNAVASLPPGSTGLFGPWAAAFGSALFCLAWPQPSGGEPLAAGPLPDVPVLILSGALDMRTPTSGALLDAARFPQAHVTVVPGVGHSVLGSDLGGCAQSSVVGWLQGGTPPTTCPPSPELLPIATRMPRSLKDAPPKGNVGGKIGRTLGAVVATLDDATAAFMFEQFGVQPTDKPGPRYVAGITSGTLVSDGEPATFNTTFRMVKYTDVPGVTLTGTLKVFPGGLPLQFQGTIKVTGAGAHGTLVIHASSITGTLGGKKVVGSTGHKGFFGPAISAVRLRLAG
jgi:pimeloyl-ACP methyl ester carboxylesterase